MTATGWTACVLVHWADSDRPRPAADGARVCHGCHAKTLRALIQLAPLHRLLGDIRAVSTTAPRSGSRSAELPIPLHPAAADHRREIHHALTEWAEVVMRARGLAPPPLNPERAPQHAVDTLVCWLLPHHDWLLYQHPVALATDLNDLRSKAWGICYPSGRRRREFAPCPDPECPGTLCAWLAPGDLLPAALACDHCGGEVAPSRWLAGRHAWLTAVQLAEVFGVSPRTVERWAVAAKWPSDGGRPARYDADVAQQAYESGRVVLTQVNGVSEDACHPAITGAGARPL